MSRPSPLDWPQVADAVGWIVLGVGAALALALDWPAVDRWLAN